VKWTIIVTTITIIVVAPTVLAIWWRALTYPHLFVHDGLIQSEAATDFVLAAKNPYIENYLNTPMLLWPFDEGGLKENPALHSYPYLPLTFLFPLPVQALFKNNWGWFDQRVIYILVFIATLALSVTTTNTPFARLAIVQLLGLNPLFAPFFIEGRNDILPLFWLVLSIHLIQRGRLIWSGCTLAAACATKQTAWFVVPFLFLYISGEGTASERITRIKPTLFTFCSIFAFIILPWLFWSPISFLHDTLAFQTGLTTSDYPISGFGFSTLLLTLGIVKSNISPFPFWAFQLTAGSIMLWLLIRRQWNDNQLFTAITNYGILLFVILFFSRAFHDNYIGYAISIMALAFFVG